MKISLSETVPYGLAHRTQRAALKEKNMEYILQYTLPNLFIAAFLTATIIDCYQQSRGDK